MTSSEIVSLFREGSSIELLSKREWEEQKKARKERQQAYCCQNISVKLQRETNKDFKLPKADRIIVGRPCTKFMALSAVEKAIYEYLMGQSRKGCNGDESVAQD